MKILYELEAKTILFLYQTYFQNIYFINFVKVTTKHIQSYDKVSLIKYTEGKKPKKNIEVFLR
jgi:hypothetical protein